MHQCRIIHDGSRSTSMNMGMYLAKRFVSQITGWTRNENIDTIMPQIEPDEPFFAIGDIHGTTPLIARILDQIDGSRQAQCPVVFLGDYIDRGDDTAGTLMQLYALSHDCTRAFTFLRGNHEQMLIDFLDAPVTTGPFWLSSGGRHTLASYGLTIKKSAMDPEEFVKLRDNLRAKLGRQLETWLRTLPLSWQSGNVFLSHAGTDPVCDLDAQTAETLLWGCRSEPFAARRDGIWTVQGHNIVERPKIRAGRVFVDTGAYATQKLTAAKVDEGCVSFFST